MYSTPPPLRSYDLRPVDPLNPLRVKEPAEPMKRTRLTGVGIPGDPEAMMSVFEACVQVGQLDRASAVIKRFGEMAVLSGHEMIELHNTYLRANINRFYSEPSIDWGESMLAWYETRIRALQLPQTPETIACMLKISLMAAGDDKRLERLINRYMGMVPGDDGLEVLTYSDILSDQDLAKVTSLCTTHNVDLNTFETIEPETEPTRQECDEISSGPEQDQEPAIKNTEVRGVDQKGLGLKSLRDVLSFFQDVNGRDISKLPHSERREFQAKLERDCVDAAIRRWRIENEELQKMGRSSALGSSALNAKLYDWQCALEARLKEEFRLCDEAEARGTRVAEDMDRFLYGPFIKQSTPARLAAVTILSVLNSMAQKGAASGAPVADIIQSLGKAIQDDIRTMKRSDELAAARKQKKAEFARRRILRKDGQVIEPRPGATSDTSPLTEAHPASADDDSVFEPPKFDTTVWPISVKAKLGSALISALVDTAKVTVTREYPEGSGKSYSQSQPAFSHTSIIKKGKKIGTLCPNKEVTTLLQTEPRADFLARHLPMLVEPEPWTQFDRGGFLEFPANIIRVKNGELDQKIYAQAALKRGDMEQVCKGLDVLGKTGWRINRPVFDVMLQAWNTGEGIANIPPLDPDIPLPEEPDSSEDPSLRRKWLNELRDAMNRRGGLHSERCFMNFQMEIANAFKEQTFYFPHNMDFRGRAYPIPTYLNHMGADNTRGLLQFAAGKELGESGLRWVKVHLANVFGFDKASLLEREKFATDHMDQIRDSVADPLGPGNKWWLQAEDPWQCLAACFELKNAYDLDDPTKYVSHLPVHQDGTCNGLQHYAALGGDRWGAQQVNLVPGDRPADVYSAVAELVRESVAKDNASGENFMAKAVDGKITRKVVKQTVMTNVYGVTFIGAQEQVLKQLKAAYPQLEAEFGIPFRLLASYLATKIFKALSTMFRGAHDIQYWLGECAGRVCKALTPEQMDRIASPPPPPPAKKLPRMKSVRVSAPKQLGNDEILDQFRSTIVWTTPLRLPVVQPYRKMASRSIMTSLQELKLQIPDRSDPVNRRKQLQAFPPNFIHSLDATHMLLSALECHELGLQFAAVHDSFWTHAADINTMNRVLRDAFIRIHNEDVVARLASEFMARYKGALYLAKVCGEEADREIMAHRRLNRLSLKDELLLERERVRLLSSSDPDEVEKGRCMVTPASIAEKYEAIDEDTVAEDMEDVGLGKLPTAEQMLKQTQAAVGAAEGDASEDASAAFGPEHLEAVRKMMNMSQFELAMETQPGSKRPWKKPLSTVWKPLSFPPIPKKGDFDVNSLKDSQYFFS